jgi:uncharacterized protein with PIN domain
MAAQQLKVVDILSHQDPLVALFIALSGLFFLIGIAQFIHFKILIHIPAFIPPVGNSKFQTKYNEHDRAVCTAGYFTYSAFLISFIFLASIVLLFLPFDFQILVFPAISLRVLELILEMCDERPEKALSYYAIDYLVKWRHNNKSIRQLRCKKCKRPLREVTGEISLEKLGLSKPQIVAAKINGINFQIWHCSYCYSQINQKTVHLYTLGSCDRNRTTHAYCPNCKERIMRITRKTLEKPTATKEGKKVEIYTCECCGRQDEKVQAIPIYNPPEPADL